MTERVKTVRMYVLEVRKRLERAGITDSTNDARMLIGEVVGFSLTDFMLKGERPLKSEDLERMEPMITRRERGEPVHRILGHREFYGLDLLLSSGTLEPRPDTEVLVDTVLPHLRDLAAKNGTARILDMGTGTGAICLALLHEVPNTSGVGSDISPDALETASRNASRYGLQDRFETIESDWFDNIMGRFDIILSNPPYIRTDVIDSLDRGVRDFDPLAALDGGYDGLLPYRIIAKKALDYLNDGGMIGVEIGYDQKIDVTGIFASNGYDCAMSAKDYGGNDRVLIFNKQAE